MECSFCRHPLSAGARACSRCGAPVEASPSPGTPAEAVASVVSRVRERAREADDAAPANPGALIEETRRHAPRSAPTIPERHASAASPQDAPAPAPAWAQEAPRPSPPAFELEQFGGHTPARRGVRFGAALLDGLLLTVYTLLLLLIARLINHPLGFTIAGVTALVSGLLYYWILNARGATLGKLMVGTRLVDYRTGDPIGTVRALGRLCLWYLMMIPWGLGFLTVLRPGGRGWHDRTVNSIVVTIDPPVATQR